MSKRSSLALLAALMMMAALSVTGCSKPAEPAAETPAATAPAEQPAAEQPPAEQPAAAPATGPVTKDVTKLVIKDTKVGTGAEAKAGKSVTVNYTGYLTDGTKFDSSLDSGQPFTFNLGRSEVIKGWDEGVEGMKVGGTRTLMIPPAMGYGDQGAGGVIPPGATLYFEVELLSVN